MEHHPGLAATAVATSGGVDGAPPRLEGGPPGLLDFAAIGPGQRILVLGPDALETACALLRRGHTSVAIVRLTDRPGAGQADVVIVPHAASVEFLNRAVPYANRVLAARGRVVIHLGDHLTPRALGEARRLLAARGFAVPRTRLAVTGTMLRAELPLFAHLPCA